MLIVFTLAIGLNAGLLFLIQPLAAKLLLPWLGGSPAVWNTSLVFYQACLLAGYGYAHLGSLWLGAKVHALVHLALIFLAFLVLPISLPTEWFATASDNPIGLLIAALTVTVGFPFFVLSAGSPLIQKWFAHSQHSGARDPYFLYAASNVGSVAGLLAYPFLLEPWLTLTEQRYIWFYGYSLLVMFLSGAALYLFSSSKPIVKVTVQTVDQNVCDVGSQKITWVRRLRWVVWSFVPSSLLLGVTSYVTTDIASMPLLWVLPLTFYLLSFVIAFARPSWAVSTFVVRRQAFFLLGAAITVFMHATEPAWILLPLHLTAFALTAVVCHGRLATDRPDAKFLTDFYFWVSLGGVLGGIFNALIAPVVFKVVVEYPFAIAAAAFLRPYVGEKRETPLQERLDWALPPVIVAILFVATFMLKQSQILVSSNEHFLLFASLGIVCLAFAYRPIRFGIGLTAMALISFLYPSPLGHTLYTDRSFFGAYRVTLDSSGSKNLLFHGTTIHGAQSIEPAKRRIPMTYYHRTGPAGQVLLAQTQTPTVENIAVVGLGSGALACHGTSKQRFTFYEIDPLVEEIARDTRLFNYLRGCPPQVDVVIGDARISLARAPDQRFDIFILDAFSSDVVPTHLLTREALELYLAKTVADGLVLIHISNRHFDLAPVLDRLADNLRLVGLIQNDFKLGPEEQDEGKSPSRWVLLARKEKFIAPFLKDGRWQRLDGSSGGELWTDEFSNTLRLVHWR